MFISQATIEAGNTVPHMNIIELPSQNYCTSANFTVPVEYDFGGQVRWSPSFESMVSAKL